MQPESQNEQDQNTPDPAAAATEPAANEPAAQEPSALDIVKNIQEKVDQMAAEKPAGTTPLTPAQMREAIKEKTGYTDEQVDFHFNSLAEAMGPMREQLAWMQLDKKFKDLDTVKPEMEEELKSYPPAMRGDPVLMEKVYFMSKGKKMNSPASSNQPAPQPRQPQGNVVSRRVANDYPGFSPSSDNSSGGGRQVQLSGEQREFARRMGQKETEYIEHMERKPVREFLSK